jgi:hypothetical protein
MSKEANTATASEPEAAMLMARLERSVSNETAIAAMRLRAPGTRVTVCVGIGALERRITVGQEGIGLLPPAPPLQPWDFCVRGTPRAWQELWQAMPQAGWHDVFALTKRGEMRIEGNLLPFMAHLQFFKDFLALPRMEHRA